MLRTNGFFTTEKNIKNIYDSGPTKYRELLKLKVNTIHKE